MRTKILRANKIILVLCIIGTLAPFRFAVALNFTPSELEWTTWPDYCRARYVVSGAGQTSEFVNRVSNAEVNAFKSQIGREAWEWLHHYCAALVYMDRAGKAETDQRKEYYLREAEVNVMGHYRLISPANAMFPQTVITIAQVHRKRGDYELSLRYLNESIQAQPAASSPYALSAMIYRDLDKLDKAKEVLVKGIDAAPGESPELIYILGLVHFEMGDLDAAQSNATEAYSLGYPLPGLAAKLKRAGRTIELSRVQR